MMQAMAEQAGIQPGTMLGVETDAEQLDLLRGDDGRLPSNVFQLMRQQAAADEKRGPGRRPGSRNKKSDQLAKLIVQKYGDPVEAMAAIYAMPLDQLVELVLVADGSKDREDRLIVLIEQTEDLIRSIYIDRQSVGGLTDKSVDKLDAMIERVGDMAKVLKSKPGELALKALNTQLAAARETALYVHSKRPVAVDVSTRADVILNIPGLTDPTHLAQIVDNANMAVEDWGRLEYLPGTEAATDEG